MAHTKAEMQFELMSFMQGYVDSFNRMYWDANAPAGSEALEKIKDAERIKKTVLWRIANEMYDYGVSGIHNDNFGNGTTLDGSYADAELFIRGLDSLALYLEEDDVRLPWITNKVVRTAVARHVLEGGERYTDFGTLETNSFEGDHDYLTLQELALLADMDERSVRNAASQKQLATEQVGKRSLVTTEEARRWLSGRKGFVLTKFPDESTNETAVGAVKKVSISLPAHVLELLELKARQLNVAVAELIENQLFNL